MDTLYLVPHFYCGLIRLEGNYPFLSNRTFFLWGGITNQCRLPRTWVLRWPSGRVFALTLVVCGFDPLPGYIKDYKMVPIAPPWLDLLGFGHPMITVRGTAATHRCCPPPPQGMGGSVAEDKHCILQHLTITVTLSFKRWHLCPNAVYVTKQHSRCPFVVQLLPFHFDLALCADRGGGGAKKCHL